MPRANRYHLPEYISHVTHRCHDRTALLKFAKDRNTYRRMLRARLKDFPVSLLSYCITSNHVHLLVKIREGMDGVLGQFMQSLEGDFAQYYNRRKKRTGAFWSDRYHAVMIDTGEYLWRCLCYIDLNMVRAGAVDHPQQWDWCGYTELAGLKKRNRLIDQRVLLEALGPGASKELFVQRYRESIDARLRSRPLVRQPCWTESLAVGSEAFASGVSRRIEHRMRVESGRDEMDQDLHVVKEEKNVYSVFQV